MKAHTMYLSMSNRTEQTDFLVNLILTRHKNPAKKTMGIVHLLYSGISVRPYPFNDNCIVVDDTVCKWDLLEDVRYHTLTELTTKYAA